ncbi:MAG: YjbH domain-containing protein [Desulfuromonadaceae bacterium]|nr:YjbH domain-containing protein [Desulfuromonadaceae bacterium]
MRKVLRKMIILYILLAIGAAQVVQAEGATPYPAALSLQGFSGILNTPSAFVLPVGTLQIMYSDQVDTRWQQIPGFWQDNYHVAVGLFDFAEISGRLTSGPHSIYGGGVRDLSASAKFSTAPFTRDYPWLPALAVGMQDVGGGASLLQSSYAVASTDLWRFRLSAGYGSGPDRMKGVFGGVELILFDWMRLLGEYDTDDTNVGIRLTTPPLPLVPVSLQLTGKTTVSGSHAGSVDFAAGLSIPLDVKEWNRPARDRTPVQSADAAVIATPAVLPDALQTTAAAVSKGAKPLPVEGTPEPVTAATDADGNAPLHRLQQQLDDAGFIRVRIGIKGTNELVVQYENVRFLYNELDALGLIAGLVTQSAPERFARVTLVTLRKGVAMTALQAPRRLLKDFIDSDNVKEQQALRELRKTVVVSNNPKTDGVRFLTTSERSWLPPLQLAVSPGLKTHIGSEIGVFDYLLSVRPEVTINPWQGGLVNIRWNLPVTWSNNFDTYQPYGFQHQKSGIDRLQFTQAFKLVPSMMVNIGGGLLDQHWYGTLNELIWQSEYGRHRSSFVQGWAAGDEEVKGWTSRQKPVADKTLYLGSYRYNLPGLDLSLEGTGGRYWNQDEGFSVGLKRFFGDVAVSVYYKNVNTLENRHIQAAGLQLSLPLTTRKSLNVGPITAGGTDEWSYAQESQIVASGEANYTNPYSIGITPQNSTTLERSYYNRDRLHAAYIISHLERMQDAWRTFGNRK